MGTLIYWEGAVPLSQEDRVALVSSVRCYVFLNYYV